MDFTEDDFVVRRCVFDDTSGRVIAEFARPDDPRRGSRVAVRQEDDGAWRSVSSPVEDVRQEQLVGACDGGSAAFVELARTRSGGLEWRRVVRYDLRSLQPVDSIDGTGVALPESFDELVAIPELLRFCGDREAVLCLATYGRPDANSYGRWVCRLHWTDSRLDGLSALSGTFC